MGNLFRTSKTKDKKEKDESDNLNYPRRDSPYLKNGQSITYYGSDYDVNDRKYNLYKFSNRSDLIKFESLQK